MSIIYLFSDAVAIVFVDRIVGGLQLLRARLMMADRTDLLRNIFENLRALFIGRRLADVFEHGLVLRLVHGRALLAVGGGALVREDGLFHGRATSIASRRGKQADQNEKLK